MIREETLERLVHPEFIGNDWQRVDHPVIAPLIEGAPTLGWEGDPRLVVYLFKPGDRFTLWRLEADGEYRPLFHMEENQPLNPDNVNALINRLIEVDSRRGFDPYVDVVTKQDAYDRNQNRILTDFIVDFADKFHYGLIRQHTPGIHATRIRNAPSRR